MFFYLSQLILFEPKPEKKIIIVLKNEWFGIIYEALNKMD